MTCPSCGKTGGHGSTGLSRCPWEHGSAHAVKQDTIIGGFWAENAWREPRYFDSQKKYEKALDDSGLMLKTPRWAKSWAGITPEMLADAKRLVERVTARQKTVDIDTRTLDEGSFSDGTGNSSKDIGGLQHIVPTDPTTGTVGSINRATFSFWRSQTKDDTGSSFSTLRANMRSSYNDCSSGVNAKHPDYWVTSQTVFEGYEGLLTTNEHVVSKDKSQFDAGFKNEYATFKGIPGSYDEDCVSDSLFFLNYANLKLAYQKGYWFKGFDAVDPANQTVDIFKVMTIANLISNNPRRLGVVKGIA